MSQTLPPHLSHPLHFLPTCQPLRPLTALLVEAEMREEREAAAEPTHSQTNLHLCREKVRKKSSRLVSAFSLTEWENFSSLHFLFFLKEKRVSESGENEMKSESEMKIKIIKKKRSSRELEPSTLPCVSFRSLECLNQCRRQLEAVGDELRGSRFQSLPSLDLDRSVHWQESYEPHQLLISAAMHHFRERPCLRPAFVRAAVMPSLLVCIHTVSSRLIHYSHNARSTIDWASIGQFGSA